ncbi:MAG: DinB family protein [Ilumatobacter sp.]
MSGEPMITPDDKDWTWVLTERCPECGFAAGEIERSDVASLLRHTARRFAAVVIEPGASERARPDRWSTLEYCAHVRDVHRLYLERLGLMLTENDPLYPNWDQDATAIDDDYASQDPAVVAQQVVETGDVLADAFDAVHGDQWSRTGRRDDGAAFTIDTFARYLIHDPVHHFWDVTGDRADR